MKLIVGLGNPGKKYEKTRHNVGFLILDSYLSDVKWQEKSNYYYYIADIFNEKVCFLKPLTFMNLSGNAVLEVSKYYKILSKDILIVHDDLYIQSGYYKLKYNSSSGGHNGINSIIDCLHTTEFSRLKIGVGSFKITDYADYVLSKLSKKEIEELKSPKYGKIIESFIVNGIEKTMCDYNNNEEK